MKITIHPPIEIDISVDMCGEECDGRHIPSGCDTRMSPPEYCIFHNNAEIKYGVRCQACLDSENHMWNSA